MHVVPAGHSGDEVLHHLRHSLFTPVLKQPKVGAQSLVSAQDAPWLPLPAGRQTVYVRICPMASTPI